MKAKAKKPLTSPKATKKSSPTPVNTSSKVANKSQVKKLIAKGLKQYKRTIKALEDK